MVDFEKSKLETVAHKHDFKVSFMSKFPVPLFPVYTEHAAINLDLKSQDFQLILNEGPLKIITTWQLQEDSL
jgi:hypothetical protein